MLKEDLKYITTEHLRDTKQISARAWSCCRYEGLNTLHDILLYFEENGSFLGMKKYMYIGTKTYEGLDDFCAKVLSKMEEKKSWVGVEMAGVAEVLNELTRQEREMLQSLATAIIETEKNLKEKLRFYAPYCADNVSFAIDFYNREGHFPLFWILEQYLRKDNTKKVKAMLDLFPIFRDSRPLTLREVATKQGLSCERVRQVRLKLFRYPEAFKITGEITKLLLQDKKDWAYILEILPRAECISRESTEIWECLKKEQCNLSTQFVLQVIARIFRDNYLLFGGFSTSKKSKQSIENTFLIKKELTYIFEFGDFMEEFKNLIAENETEYDLTVEELLSNDARWNYIVGNKGFDKVVRVVKDLLSCEFHVHANPEGLITVPTMNKGNPTDVVREILKRNGNPMHLNDIFMAFKKIFPDDGYAAAEQLRPCLQKNEAIVPFKGRSGFYSLRAWEHVKAGSIRDVIFDFLMNNDSPQTVKSITEYVLRYFPQTNYASVRASLSNDTKNRFSFFENRLIGSASKKYAPKFKEVIKIEKNQKRSFEQRLRDFEKFLSENDHFPFSLLVNPHEISLYRWWKITNKHTKKLTAQQKKEIERIKKQYADFEIYEVAYKWIKHCNEFKRFVLENRRLPKTSGSERLLYDWFYRAKNEFLNNRLNERQKIKYAELLKAIKFARK